jgi:hypothetical protein
LAGFSRRKNAKGNLQVSLVISCAIPPLASEPSTSQRSAREGTRTAESFTLCRTSTGRCGRPVALDAPEARGRATRSPASTNCGPAKARYHSGQRSRDSEAPLVVLLDAPDHCREFRPGTTQRPCCPSRATSEISEPGYSCRGVQQAIFITPILLDRGRKGASRG